MYAYKLIKITLLISLVFVLMGCGGIAKLPPEVSNELEKISGLKIAALVLVGSKTGKTEYFKHADTVVERADILSASAIKKITSTSVVRVKGVKREYIDENYQLCNYITIDGETELICKNTERQEPDQYQGIPNLPPKLTARLKEISNVGDFSYLTLTDIITGETKLFKNTDYEQVTSKFPQAISAIKISTPATIATFKSSCKQWITVAGESVVVRRKDINC